MSTTSTATRPLPFFYGWVVVGVAFLTLAIGVNSRTAFSVLFPAILDEFGWARGVTAAAFSVGFVASIAFAPLMGFLLDRFGPRLVIPLGAMLVSSGFLLTTQANQPWTLYLTLGVLVVGGSIFMSYIGHAAFLPNWFDRRRGLAIGIAFSGVGVGSIVLLPGMQHYIESAGWRQACVGLAVLILLTVVPINVLLQRHRPEDLGLNPDGDAEKPTDDTGGRGETNIVDAEWARRDWTVGMAVRTRRYWLMFLAFFTALYGWYAVQVHQTQYLVEIGIDPERAAIALGLVGFSAIGGQIVVGHLSDRIGREWGWAISCFGFALCYGLLIVLRHHPSLWLAYTMACVQGFLGYGIAPLIGSVAAEIFESRRFGVIFGTLSGASSLGAGVGPWATGWMYDRLGNYDAGFAVAGGVCLLSAGFMWLAAPRKVRTVAGQRPRGRAGRNPGRDELHAVALGPTPIRLVPGERRTVRAQALDRLGSPISGKLRYRWHMERSVGNLESADAMATIVAGESDTTGTVVVTARRGRASATAKRTVTVAARD